MFDPIFQSFRSVAGLVLPSYRPVQARAPHDGARWNCVMELNKFAADIEWYRNVHGKEDGERRFFFEQTPFETIRKRDNVLTVGGASIFLEAAKGAAPTYFSNANSYIGVGDSSTTEVRSQTDLQAASNKLRVAMDSTYPTHSTGTAVKTITGATNATPIVVTSASHGYSNGDFVHVASVAGNTAANGLWSIANQATNTFELVGSVGSGAYTSGGDVTVFNVMVWQSTFSTSQANFAWNEWGIFNASAAGTMLNRKTFSGGTKTSAASWQFKVAIALG